MTDQKTNRRRFLGSAAAAAVGAVAGKSLEAKARVQDDDPWPRREAGLLIRGGDGGLYYIPDSRLAAFRIPAKEAPKLQAALPRAEAGDLPRETAAVCATAMRNVSRVTFVDVASIRRRARPTGGA